MRKVFSLLLTIILLITLTACSGGDDAQQNGVSDELASVADMSQSESVLGEETEIGTMADAYQSNVGESEEANPYAGGEPSRKILLVYFSHTNNTQFVADYIANRINADVMEIVPVNPYPINYNDNLAVARQELDEDARPAIQFDQPDFAEYDTIILGYPIWHGTFPRPVATFLENWDLSDKQIAPFCTSGSSSIMRSVGELEELAPDATILTGIGITSNTLENAEELVNDWLTELGLL